MSRRPSLRTKAKLAGEKYYFTWRPCSQGHYAQRWTNSAICTECNKLSVEKWRSSLGASETFKIHKRQYNKNRYNKLRTSILARVMENYHKRKHDPYFQAKRRGQGGKRRKQIKQATPTWADQHVMVEFYMNCPGGYEVDHIYPILSPWVCGLHVIENLRYLPKKQNRQKGNRDFRHEQ